ncbi:MAG: hypothetical protein F4201_05435 [Nitrospira sp. SB0677_bin_15]|nr:hypothetical protein [Nitrospira sp. SB0677_bin_15]MYH01473.1 hypothetical protein [Nitrospira sp. SB0675_bin_23]
MIALEKFLEPIELANMPLSEIHRAYRMDGNSPQPDMRKDAGLGTCACCDYFVTNNDSVFLIEETQLLKSIKRWKREVQYLNDNDQKNFVDEKVKTENCLKVYGSLLVLARLMNKFPEIKNLVGEKKYCFWLVVSGLSTPEDRRYIDNLKDSQLDA